jgi:site-specific recombinase XerD
MTYQPTISEGIQNFINEFDFHSRDNTKRAYLRAVALFQEYLSTAEGADTARNFSASSSLSELPDTIFAGFMSWLRVHPYPVDYRSRTESDAKMNPSPTLRKYSVATINLYETAIQRMLQFWRARRWLSFSELSQAEVIKASGTSNTKKNRSINRRASAVPENFGLIMLNTANGLVFEMGKAKKSTHLARLEVLRARCLIHILMATGLRASDVAKLTIRDIENARSLGGYMVVAMKKTDAPAYCYLFPPVFESIDAYLTERKDRSPWLFIQHGRSGKQRQGTADYFASNTHKGYGAPISTTTVWRIVRSIATAAGYKGSDENLFLSPHAMRHWFAQSLRDADVPIDDIQSALGHASSETTKAIYAPLPNLKRLIQAQGEIQSAGGRQSSQLDTKKPNHK